jgi:hypothetical protein
VAIDEKKVAELAGKSGLSTTQARSALEKHGGEVDPTLEKLIDSGEVTLTMLNPKLAGPAMFMRAQVMRTAQAAKEAMAKLGMDNAAVGDFGPLLEMYGQFLGNAKPPKSAVPALERLVESEKRREALEKRSPMELRLPPFGKLTFAMYVWQGEAVLRSWAGFQTHVGTDGSRPSKGKVALMITPPRGAGEVPAPAKEQVAAFEYVKEHEEELSKAVLGAVFDEYPKLRRKYREFGDEELMPEIERPEELKKLIQLGALHVLNVSRGGRAYVGFDLECNWDDEHGLGVMTHGERVVAIGIADASFDEQVALSDGGRELR